MIWKRLKLDFGQLSANSSNEFVVFRNVDLKVVGTSRKE
jgi:hypothetical protein